MISRFIDYLKGENEVFYQKQKDNNQNRFETNDIIWTTRKFIDVIRNENTQSELVLDDFKELDHYMENMYKPFLTIWYANFYETKENKEDIIIECTRNQLNFVLFCSCFEIIEKSIEQKRLAIPCIDCSEYPRYVFHTIENDETDWIRDTCKAQTKISIFEVHSLWKEHYYDEIPQFYFNWIPEELFQDMKINFLTETPCPHHHIIGKK
jgi:hypothetical protein